MLERLSPAPSDKRKVLQRVCVPVQASLESILAFCYIKQSDKVVLLTRLGHVSNMNVFTQDQAFEEWEKFESERASHRREYCPTEVYDLHFSGKSELLFLARATVQKSSLNHLAKDDMLNKIQSLDNVL